MRHVYLCLIAFFVWTMAGRAATNATLDELFFDASRYGNTPEKRARKEPARQELFARGVESLDYLMARIHIENLWIRILAQQVVEQLDSEIAAPVLLASLESEHEDTRKLAMYFLGFYELPIYVDRIIPFLEDDNVAASTVRTLGKWKVQSAVSRVHPFLSDAKERRRVIAANALRDIGNTEAIPYLIEALDDPMFTVRNTAARALVSFGEEAEKPLVRALKDKEKIVGLRQVVRCLGEIESRKAVRSLRKLLEHHDPGVRRDAEEALRRIDPKRVDKWVM